MYVVNEVQCPTITLAMVIASYGYPNFQAEYALSHAGNTLCRRCMH